MQWGSSLFREVDILEKDKRRLEGLLATAQEQQGRCQADLEHARSKCQELEQRNSELERFKETQQTLELELRSVSDQNADLRKQLAAYAAEVDESLSLQEELKRVLDQNQHLRKQLAAYAVEIDESRNEHERTKCELHHFQEAAHYMAEERQSLLADAKDRAQQLRIDQLQRCSGSEASAKEPAGVGAVPGPEKPQEGTEDALTTSSGPVEEAATGSTCASPAGSIRPADEVPAFSFGPPVSALAGSICRADMVQNRGAEVEAARNAELAQTLQDLRSAYATLQESYVAQIQDFSRFVAAVKTCKDQTAADWQTAKEQLGDYEQLSRSIRLLIANSQQGAGRSGRSANGTASGTEIVQDGKKLWQDGENLWRDGKETWQDGENLYQDLGCSELFQDGKETERKTSAEDVLRLQNTKLKDQLKAEQKQHADCRKELTKLKAPVIARNKKREERLAKSPEQAILQSCLDHNIAWEMRMSQRGFEFEKVHERNHKREPRFVALFPEEMLLKWRKPQSQSFTSTLDIWELIRIDYGTLAKPCVIYDQVQPWLCFSLYTVRRSYDFICPSNEADVASKRLTCPKGHPLEFHKGDRGNCYCDGCEREKVVGADVWKCQKCEYDLCARCATNPREDAVQCLVLAISRLARWAKGAVSSKRQFVALKGWCKVEDYCMRRRITLAQAFREAIMVTVNPSLRAIQSPGTGARVSPVEIASERTRTSVNQRHLGGDSGAPTKHGSPSLLSQVS